MKVRVRFFASLRDVVGCAAREDDLPEGATPEALWQRLVGEHPELAPRRASLAAAVNREYVGFDHPLAEGDEIAFIPPVSGG